VTLAAVLALPAFDTLLVMLGRLLHRQNPFLPDKTHLHHRLMDLGLSHKAVVSTLYVTMAGFGILAWAVRGWEEWRQTAAVLLAGTGVYGLVFLCQRGGVRFRAPGGTRRHGNRVTVRPMRYLTEWAKKRTPAMSWILGAGLCVPVAAAAAVPGEAGAAAFAIALVVALLFPWRSAPRQTSLGAGLMYALCFAVFGILNLLSGGTPWIRVYLAAYSGIVLMWVLLKVKDWSPQQGVMEATGIEALLIGISLLVPLAVIHATGTGEGARDAILAACLESVPLLLALKILVRKQVRRLPVLAATLLLPLLLVGVRGLWVRNVTAPSLLSHVPARTAQSTVLCTPSAKVKLR
jgi:UDP-GlcNAc:undecaprenyl-phosphate GlcNAc-1-phosphate transferase